jgi:phage gpG-like protein
MGEIEERLVFSLRTLQDLSPFLMSLKPVWAESREEMFATQGFGKWPSYMPSESGYVGYKKAVTNEAKLLKFNKNPNALRLYKSLTQTNHPDFVWSVGPLALRVGTDVVYAEKHLTGGSTPKWGGVTYPIRNFLQLGTFSDKLAERLGIYAADVGDAIAYDHPERLATAGL